MINKRDRQIIEQYRETVFLIHSTKLRIEWNRRHGLPVLGMPEQVRELIQELSRFEDIMSSITDIKARNIIAFRYVFGLSVQAIADIMGISRGTVTRIIGDFFTNTGGPTIPLVRCNDENGRRASSEFQKTRHGFV